MITKDTVRFNFKDSRLNECSLENSSFKEEPSIWLGMNKAKPNGHLLGEVWLYLPLPEQFLTNNRMHLTQTQVKELLPYLQEFVETGKLPEKLK